MYEFIINKNEDGSGTGEHEVHNLSTGCKSMPKPENRIPLGFHVHCQSALHQAKLRYPQWKVDGCAHCAPNCHTR